MQVVSITGHRPKRLDLPYDYTKWQWEPIRAQIELALETLRADRLITGMALGVDQLAAEVASRNGVPFIAAIPFEGYEARWPAVAKERYEALLDIAESQIIVSEGGYSPQKLFVRNEWMLKHSTETIAVWDGKQGGGTAATVKSARRTRDVWVIRPDGTSFMEEWIENL